ncbi:hypothetical protein CASFOL_027739 [Castilleja foliolosa]|uniref:Uncharacterized protein n=1 Tax=Castilleja foliolosa TaxID=1961234 RepID=A0ABD3CFP0_9LAMI
MGNCQAIDNASLVIQHPSGRVNKMYWPIGVSEIMKMNPGHYVALLLTTTLYSSPVAAAGGVGAATGKIINSISSVNNDKNTPLRITRIKLLRPADTLVLGHVYRLVTSQEVMKGVLAKKQSKTKQKISSEFEAVIRKNHEMEKTKQAKHERYMSRNKTQVISSAVSKSRAWQPSLKSISEAAGS